MQSVRSLHQRSLAPPRSLRIVAVAAVLLFVASACGDDNDIPDEQVAADEAVEGDQAGDAAPDAEAAPTEPLAPEPGFSAPVVEVPPGDAPTELVIEDIVVGNGETAVEGSILQVHYTGVLHADGTQFDSSWDRGQPFSFTLGLGQVIAGWDQGVAGMSVGGRRMLVIPSDLAYGEAGSGSGSIGANESLVFVVDLLSVQPPPYPLVDPADEPAIDVPDEAPTELVIDDVTEGEGDPIEAGDFGVFHYVAATQSDGAIFDSSWSRSTPIELTVGVGQVIPGFDQGVLGMQVGGRRQIAIPPDLAYGDEGAGPIGPGETVVFVVDLIAIESGG